MRKRDTFQQIFIIILEQFFHRKSNGKILMKKNLTKQSNKIMNKNKNKVMNFR